MNYCLERGRMRSHKSNRVLFLCLLISRVCEREKCYTFYVLFSVRHYAAHTKSCAVLSRYLEEILDEVEYIAASLIKSRGRGGGRDNKTCYVVKTTVKDFEFNFIYILSISYEG
ncbi:hypothetical protein PUN28_013211 [Cardiocondyla obscurior]|uniref:Secreted protein n=1 Tax=Cardiocondyla obscurior TaxID=286306 RepID=A0AAW2F8R7_9HYME